jgi:hypothetical protein
MIVAKSNKQPSRTIVAVPCVLLVEGLHPSLAMAVPARNGEGDENSMNNHCSA